ncbi:conjugative transfer relaxase/helicase TraI domain-containing protein, partial [Arsenophonus nasoniae]|uniref:conjugative transfer relaxase/helicase TraI domain-containing protein n=1 Tax=Arsenophonus nasoniae TaxID=638 RepID=UPI003879E83F
PYVIVYEGARTLAAMDNTYVELSRAKEHVQLYLSDGNAWMEALTKNSGDRVTAHDILNKQEDQLARNEIRIWDNSQKIGNTKLAQKIDQTLLEVARFSHHDSPELLLPVTNEHGIQRGNLHIPVGVYTGKTNIEEATYKGASDGIYIVLNKGNDENSINLYSLSQFDEALKNDTKDNTIVIELNNEESAKNIAQQTESEKINENQDRTGEVPLFLNKNSEENEINRYSLKEFDESIKNDIKDNTIQLELNKPDNEASPQLPQEDKLEKVDDNKDVIFESIRLNDEEKMPDIQLGEEPPKLEKENDEINISYHHEEEKNQKIKEKEYGG